MKFQLNYCRKADGGGFFTETCHNLSETQTQERLKDVEGVHDELIKDCKERYIEQSKKLIEMENRFEKCRTKLNNNLETIWQSSILKMDCEFVKGRK